VLESELIGLIPQAALAGTNLKFRQRFAKIEAGLAARGRTAAEATMEEMDELFREGARRSGYRGKIPAYETELETVRALVRKSHRGDVAAVMTHVERAEVFEWLKKHGFSAVTVERVRELVRRT